MVYHAPARMDHRDVRLLDILPQLCSSRLRTWYDAQRGLQDAWLVHALHAHRTERLAEYALASASQELLDVRILPSNVSNTY